MKTKGSRVTKARERDMSLHQNNNQKIEKV